jgi:hypothetical protein
MRLKLAPMGLDPGLDPVVHLLRDKFFLRSGWIASDLGLARGSHINKVPHVGYTRLAVSSPAMTEVSAYDRKMLSRMHRICAISDR